MRITKGRYFYTPIQCQCIQNITNIPNVKISFQKTTTNLYPILTILINAIKRLGRED